MCSKVPWASAGKCLSLSQGKTSTMPILLAAWTRPQVLRQKTGGENERDEEGPTLRAENGGKTHADTWPWRPPDATQDG